MTENFSKLKYLLTGLLQKKFAYNTHGCGKEKGKVNDELEGLEGGALTMVGEMNATK